MVEQARAATAGPGEPVQLTFLGGSTAMLVVGGVRLLIDPCLPGPGRLTWGRRATIEPPEADVVLISHGRGRRPDLATLRRLPGRPWFHAPSPVAPALRRAGLEPVIEVGPGGIVRFGGLALQAIGAEPSSFHGPRAGGGAFGYLLHGSGRVYVPGGSHGLAAPWRLGEVDLALLPVGPGPRSAGRSGVAAAAETAALVRPRVVVPIGWGRAEPSPRRPAWFRGGGAWTAGTLEAALARELAARGVETTLQVVAPGYATVVQPPRSGERVASVRPGETVSPSRSRVGLRLGLAAAKDAGRS